MPAPRDNSIPRLTILILAPVVLLATIAIFGLVEYRHAIMEDARAEATQWASDDDVTLTLAALRSEAQSGPVVHLFSEIPTNVSEADPADEEDVKLLQSATANDELVSLQRLLDSTARTNSGLPVRVLAAWHILELNHEMENAERLATFAIHEAPSAISAPIVKFLNEKFLERTDWTTEWTESEERRGILREHPQTSGFVSTSKGPAFVDGDRVLTPGETSATLREIHGSSTIPAWMSLDYIALDESMIGAVENPIASVGTELRIVAGVGDSDALFARYRRGVWWVSALILCSLLTAVAGILLARRTVNRERRLHQLKSQFVASVSHELRAPVASMRLMADALDAGRVEGVKAREFHRLISQEGARLSSLIENVLEFARIEEGKKHYRFSETDLPALLRDTVRLMEPVSHERDITISTSLPESAPSSTLDAHAIQQAVINLLDNAIKFSPGGSVIKVNLEVTAHDWKLSISDCGPGIAPENRSRVFERFVRLENELQRETQGAGIGLSIVKHTINAHGGGVHSESNAEGGTTFVMRCGNSGPVRDGQEECSSQELALEQPRELKTRDVPS